MKKVIFVCLLTLSVCLSDTVSTDNAKQNNKTDVVTTKVITPTPSASHPIDSKNGAKSQDTEKPSQNTDAKLVPEKPSTDNATAADTTPAPETTSTNATTTNSPDGKPDKASSTTVKPTEHAISTSPVPATEKATTQKPAATTAQPHTLQARGFDGASFVGGIILTLGLLAIGFMGFKYYKAQTERNYHTL